MLKTSASGRTKQKLILSAIFACAFFALAKNAQAATYYVDATNGNDSWTGTAGARAGTTSTGPWRSITKVNSSVSASGDRVYFKAGTTTILPASPASGLTVDWANATVGSYYLDSGNNPVIGTGSHGKAKLSGSGGQYPSGWPGNYYTAIRIYTANAVIQDLEIFEVNGNGIWIEARDGFTPHNPLVQRCDIHHNRMNGLALINLTTPTAKYCDIWENNEYDARGLDDGTGWGASVSFRGTTNALFQYNRVWRNWGEGIGFYSRNNGARILDNVSYDNRRPNVYYDCNANGVIARNLIYRTHNTITYSPYNGGIVVTAEDWHPNNYCTGYLNNLEIWGNLVSGNTHNLYVGAPWAMDNINIYNNTFVEPISNSNHQNVYTDKTITNSSFKNNIILQSSGNLANIAIFTSGFTRSNNIWSHASASIDADARGSGDRYSAWPILKTAGWTYTGIAPNSLTGAEFSLPAGSVAIDAGANLCPSGCASGFAYDTLLNVSQSNLTVPTWINTTQSGAWDAGAAPFAAAIIPDTPPAAPTGLSIR